MVTASLFPTSYTARSTLCRSCLLRSLAAGRHQTRSIALKVVEKQRLARLEWSKKAQQIKDGEVEHLWEILKARGFVKNVAGTDKQIYELMRLKRIGAYVGIDPTASSLHLGHLLPLMALFWMYIHGYRAISVIGGSTAKIGDPTDRLKTRDPITRADMSMNITKMHYQLKRIWLNVDIQGQRFGYEKDWSWRRALLNNSSWYNQVTFVDVASRLFRGMRLGPMLSRDTVKRKMDEGDGMSLAEFVYPLMQAWDWWYMFSGKLDVNMQIGGSDQYGNIVTGIDCIKYMRDTEPDPQHKMPPSLFTLPVGFTVPLLTDSSGAKFGKSAGNAVWLDPFKTSSFDLYGYLMRRPDDDVERLLKLFTFYPLKQIQTIMQRHNRDRSKRQAQHALAYEVVALVHGLKEAKAAEVQHMMLFSKGSPTESESTRDQVEVAYPEKGSPATHEQAVGFRTDIKLPRSLVMGKSIGRILYASGLADSASDGHRLVAHQGAYVGGAPGQAAAKNKGMSYGELTFTPVKNWFQEDTKNFLIDDKLLILRRGKHFVRVVEVVSDEEWEASGLTYPGEAYKGVIRQFRSNLKTASHDDDLNSAVKEVLAEDEASDEQILFPRKSRAALLLQGTQVEMLEKSGIKVNVRAKTRAIDNLLRNTEEILNARREEEQKEMEEDQKEIGDEMEDDLKDDTKEYLEDVDEDMEEDWDEDVEKKEEKEREEREKREKRSS